jgi:Amt family ammonium transporter
MPDVSTLTTGLAFLIPIGYALIAMGGLTAGAARRAAISALAALGLAAAGFLATGFALQFGGVGLLHTLPGLEELVWEWSALGPSWGAGWGMAGLSGWAMTGAAATPGAYALALASLPWVATAVLIPVLALQGRVPRWAIAWLGLLTAAVIFPLAGNWIWGGGWLANLGSNLGLGHGLVDVSGAGLVHLLGAAVALAGLLVVAPVRPRAASPDAPQPLPAAHFPLLALLGIGLLLVGNLAWTTANPLLGLADADLPRLTLNTALAAGGGALLALAYTWLVAGRPDPLMAARGCAAGAVTAAATAPFVAPWAALAVGAGAGLLTPLILYASERVLRRPDETATLTVHGLGGLLGLLALGVFADGAAGAGWNNVGMGSYLEVVRQGVTGLLPAPGFLPDWPGQMQAQAVGAAALALFGFFAAWLAIAPLAAFAHLLRRPEAPKPTVVSTPSAENPTETPADPPAESDGQPTTTEKAA